MKLTGDVACKVYRSCSIAVVIQLPDYFEKVKERFLSVHN